MLAELVIMLQCAIITTCDCTQLLALYKSQTPPAFHSMMMSSWPKALSHYLPVLLDIKHNRDLIAWQTRVTSLTSGMMIWRGGCGLAKRDKTFISRIASEDDQCVHGRCQPRMHNMYMHVHVLLTLPYDNQLQAKCYSCLICIWARSNNFNTGNSPE